MNSLDTVRSYRSRIHRNTDPLFVADSGYWDGIRADLYDGVRLAVRYRPDALDEARFRGAGLRYHRPTRRLRQLIVKRILAELDTPKEPDELREAA